jgi:hypothetical protein
MAELFFSYSHADETLRNELEKHLSMLKREGAITTWHDRRIVAGDPIDGTISRWLEKAEVVLLLVSADFLASEYCYGVEMTHAIQRHEAGEAKVIPVILRPCDWHPAPFGKMLATPRDGKAVTLWPNQDEAFLDVAKAIRAALAPNKGPARSFDRATSRTLRSQPADDAPRSSNLRISKTFTDRDKHDFLDQSFEYILEYFRKSLYELHARNPEIETKVTPGGNTFEATVYRDGKEVARCIVRHRDNSFGHSRSITLAHGLRNIDNGINESLSVVAGDQSLALQPMGMAFRGERQDQLSLEGAAEYYWSIFIEPLQQ